MSSSLAPKIQIFRPGADLSALQFSAVKFDGSGNVISCSADDAAIGILMNAPVLKDVAEVSVEEGARIKCSGAVTRGDKLRAAASGKMVTVTAGGYDAIAMDSGVDGDVIPVIIEHGYFTT